MQERHLKNLSNTIEIESMYKNMSVYVLMLQVVCSRNLVSWISILSVYFLFSFSLRFVFLFYAFSVGKQNQLKFVFSSFCVEM